MTNFEEFWPKEAILKLVPKESPSKGDTFEALVSQYHKLVMALIHRYYGGQLRDQSEDLSQEIWTKLWKAFKKNENNVIDFKSYLYRTVQTTLWDAIRSQGPLVEDAEKQTEKTTHFGQDAVHARLSLEQMMRGLKLQEKRMVRAYLKGFNNAEIAELLGCSEGRIRNLLSRLKKKMAKLGDV